MIVRDEKPSDRQAVYELVTRAFGRRAEADLVEALRADADAAISLVTDDGDRIVGHAVFSRMKAPFRALGLGPVAVLPERQREGGGGLMIRAGLEAAERQGWQGVFVLGEPEYYRRFGFDPALASGFDCVYAGPHLMVRPLGGELPTTTGFIEYAPAFARMAAD